MGLFSIVGGLLGGNSIKKGLNKASNAQQGSSDDQIARLEQALSSTTAGYSPYTQLGSSAAGAYGDLLGIGGGEDWDAYLSANPDVSAAYAAADKAQFPTVQDYAKWHYSQYGAGEGRASQAQTAEGAQGSAIDRLQQSPLFSSMVRNGEESILANASATGGLRGGNIQGGLADFRSDTLAKVIQNQLAGYQGAIGTGMGAQGAVTAAQYGTAQGSNQAQQSATDVLIQKIMGKAGVNSQNWNNIGAGLDKALSGGGAGKAISTIGKLF